MYSVEFSVYLYNREDNDYEEKTYCFIGLLSNGNDANAGSPAAAAEILPAVMRAAMLLQ